MQTILQIVRKEWIQFKRDRKMVGLSFVAPILQLVLLGYAANFDVTHIPTLVCDQDRSASSRDLADRFARSGYFDLVGRITDIRELDRYLDRGQATVALVIPSGFGTGLAGGKQSVVQLLMDGSDASAAATGMNYALLIAQRFSEKVILQRGFRRPGMETALLTDQVRVWYNPELASRNFMVPGMLALLLMVMTMMLTSLAIVKEKEIGTLEQLIVTPIRPWQLLLGKLAPFIFIGGIDVVLVVLVARFWFAIPIRGNGWLLFGLSGVFLMTTLGLGLLVSTVSDTQQQAMLTAVFFVILPMIFFSGFVFPIESMPRGIQYFSYLLPLRYYFIIIRGIFLKGVGLTILWDEAVALLAFGVVIFSVSALRFKKRLG